MDKRKIAGGIFAVVAIVVPTVLSVMDFRLAQPIGFAIIAVCAALLLLGAMLVFAPRSKTSFEVAEERRAERQRQLVETLGELLQDGENLKWRVREGHEVTRSDAEAWSNHVYIYLREEMSLASATQYLSDSGLATMVPQSMALGSEGATIYQWLNKRLTRLNAILDKIS